MDLRRYLRIEAVGTPGASAVAYVPLVVLSRGLAFLRLLVVARLLGDAGKGEFGLYQPAQELINWIVPVVLFGVADVAERYASRMEKEGRLGGWLRGQYVRLGAIGAIVVGVMLALSPWVAEGLLHVATAERARGMVLVGGCAVTIVALAVYQHLAAVLRGVRAYGASAGMELLSASLFLVFAAVAAWHGGAVSLVFAYAGSVILAVLFYGWRLWGFVRDVDAHPLAQTAADDGVLAGGSRGNFQAFAVWAFVRLLLMMTFSAVSVLGVGFLAAREGVGAHDATADYAMPYRVAQLLAYVAITLWASTYGIAARAWSHGQVRRAHVQLFRVGKFGAVALTVIAVALLLGRGVLAAVESSYAGAINELLPALLAVFIWYGLMAFCCVLTDLHEQPRRGAMLWGVAVAVQLGAMLWSGSGLGAKEHVIAACACGMAAGLLVAAPVMLWRPFRFSATAMPVALLAATPLSLFLPTWVVDDVAPVVMLGAVGFLWMAGLLIRPVDRRAWRRWRGAAQSRGAATAGGAD